MKRTANTLRNTLGHAKRNVCCNVFRNAFAVRVINHHITGFRVCADKRTPGRTRRDKHDDWFFLLVTPTTK